MSETTGQRLRRQVLGDTHTESAIPVGDEVSAAFVGLAERNVWEGPWAREGLAIKDRSLCTISLLIAGGHADELDLHFRGALRNGWWSVQELVEVCLHSTSYCGFPKAREALNVLLGLADTELSDEGKN